MRQPFPNRNRPPIPPAAGLMPRGGAVTPGEFPLKSRAGALLRSPVVFLAPYLIITAIFFVYPFFSACLLAFEQISAAGAAKFVGLANFAYIFHDPRFYKALLNTAIYAGCVMGIQLPLSLLLALLLNTRRSRTQGFFRLLIFSPNLVGQIFVGVLFSVLFMPRFGLVNVFLYKLFGAPSLLNLEWLLDERFVLPAVFLAALWLQVGFNMIYFLAALQNVDHDLLDAAQIDGAGPWRVFWNVILPSIRHVTIFVLVVNTIGAFQLFELPYALLNTTFGPNDAGLTVVGYLYTWAFSEGDLGTGAAIGWVLVFIIGTISLVQIKISRTVEE